MAVPILDLPSLLEPLFTQHSRSLKLTCLLVHPGHFQPKVHCPQVMPVLFRHLNRIPENAQPNIVALGQLLYSRYLFPFEIAGLILLVAMVGAIVLTHRRRSDPRTPNMSKQIRRRPQDAVKMTQPAVGEGVKL